MDAGPLSTTDASGLSPAALLERGIAELAADRPAAAEPLLQQALAREPGLVAAFRRLQEAQARRGELTERCVTGSGDAAMAACERALLPGARDEVRLLARMFDLAILAADRPAAQEFLRQASALRPQAPALRFMQQALERRYGTTSARYSNLPTQAGRWR